MNPQSDRHPNERQLAVMARIASHDSRQNDDSTSPSRNQDGQAGEARRRAELHAPPADGQSLY